MALTVLYWYIYNDEGPIFLTALVSPGYDRICNDDLNLTKLVPRLNTRVIDHTTGWENQHLPIIKRVFSLLVKSHN